MPQRISKANLMRHWRWGLLALLYAFLIFGGSLLGHWFSQIAAIDVRPLNEPQVHRMVMTATLVYVVASALPFVPGAEIGFALILALGPRIAVLVYGAMVLALLLSYLVGRFVPYSATAAIFGLFGLHKARDLVLQLGRLDAAGRLAMLTANAPQRIVPFLLRHRFLALAAAINIPGNSLIGGGGGIALIAGMSGIYPLPRFFLTIALAVAPIPVLVLSTGHLPA